MLSSPAQNLEFSQSVTEFLEEKGMSKEHLQILEQYPELKNAEIWGQKRPHVTQYFGERPEVYTNMKGHDGIDFRMRMRTPIFAPIEGEIRIKNSKDGYGKHVRIYSHHSKLEVVIGHFDEITVQSGRVNRHDFLGLSGNTGFSSGPHLHLGVRRLIESEDPIQKWSVENYNNGFFGYFDPLELLITWKGTLNNNTFFW